VPDPRSQPAGATGRVRETDGNFDAIVVGAGINGMTAAALLAREGWSVALLDAAEDIGGFIGSAELTQPGYLHDVWSSWHPLFLTGAGYARLGPDLHRHGLEYANTDGALTASVADDGTVTMAYRDPVATAAEFADPADRASYLAALQRFGAHVGAIGGLLGSELRGPALVRHGLGLARPGGTAELEAYARDVASSGRAWCRREFRGHEVDHLWAPWLLHAGLSPDHASGGLLIPVFAASLHSAGVPVVVGGAGRFVRAFRALLDELGVAVRTGTRVVAIDVTDGRAAGVSAQTAAGEVRLRAAQAVLASVTPAALYTELLPAHVVPADASREALGYRFGRAAAQMHVALSGPVPWTDERLGSVPLIHLSDGSASTAIACAEAEAGLVPRRPTVVVGQQHLLDPSRVPEGAATLWLQLQEMPRELLGDAAGEIDTAGGWTPAVVAAVADRVLARIEHHAPGLAARIVGRHLIGPADLTAHNLNAVGGDPYGGSAELDQNLMWRPGPATARHRTAVPGLWHIGASTHPGPGLGGASGHLVAEQLTRPNRAAALLSGARRVLTRDR
jgi:phytoene dehydrogenase-like protein